MKSTIIVILISLLVAGFCAFKWQYPFGVRSGALPCVVSALVVYSSDHNGWFPQGSTNPTHDLQKLAPNYTHIESLAGLSGDIRVVQKAYREVRSIPTNATSWIYYPGLRSDDPPGLMMIWEKEGGITFNGHRATSGSHAVGFVNGEYRQIDGQQWEGFFSNQSVLRHNILSDTNRKSKRQ